jgi:hypothetical protein
MLLVSNPDNRFPKTMKITKKINDFKMRFNIEKHEFKINRLNS